MITQFSQRSGRPVGQTKSHCKACDGEMTKAWRAANPGRAEENNRAWRLKMRMTVLEHYSGGTPRCACCGETEYVFLAIDHINDDGNIERAQAGYSRAGFCARLVRDGFPEGYQVLCHNCNWAKRVGVCPHQLMKAK